MNTYIKRALCVMAGISVIAASVSAAELDRYEIDENTKTLTLYGTIDGAKQYDDITVQLLKKGKTFDASKVYTGNALNEDFLLFTQVLADQNGGYCISVDMSGEEVGFYNMRVNGKETAKKVFYATTAERAATLEQINQIINPSDGTKTREESINELVALMDLNNEYSDLVGVLNLSADTIFMTRPYGLCEAIYETLKKDGIKDETIVDSINKASYIEAIREGLVHIADYAAALSLDQKYTQAYDRFSEGTKNSFTAKYFKDKNYLTQEQVAEAYKAAVLSASVSSFGGWGDVEYFVTEFGSVVGLNVSAYNALATAKKSQFYDAVLQHGAFSTPESFKVFANAKITELAGSSSVTPSGGSGGGSSYSGGGGIVGSKTEASDPITPQQEEEKIGFTDLDGYDWAKESIALLSEKGIVNGVGENLFDPARHVTREEFLAMLMRAYQITPDNTLPIAFSDVDAAAWYAGYVAVAAEKNMINGISDTSFGVGNEISRQDAAVMAYRIAAANGREFAASDRTGFADHETISDYAAEAVYAMRAAGIINGKDNNQFCPADSCTRAEAAKMICGLIQ